jgi:anthranilate phosphoribosyltransferase
MKEILNNLIDGNVLTREEAIIALSKVASGTISNEEIASFLTIYNMRKITPTELLGFRDAMLNLAVPVNVNSQSAIDVCGTGGDGKNTFNISTLTAFILAGAGAKVVKHGNYGLSSPIGSSNIFEYFGYKFSTDSNTLQKELDECGICYFHAPLFHPAMKHVGPVRKALKIKTFFNMLGPMINPSHPKYQFIGVYNPIVQQLYAEVYQLTDIHHEIVHSADGYDEISLTGDFTIYSKGSREVYNTHALGFSNINPEEIHGGNTIEEAGAIFLSILEGRGTKAQNDVVVVNSAFALKCYFPQISIFDALEMATESIKSKKALSAFKKLFKL